MPETANLGPFPLEQLRNRKRKEDLRKKDQKKSQTFTFFVNYMGINRSCPFEKSLLRRIVNLTEHRD